MGWDGDEVGWDGLRWVCLVLWGLGTHHVTALLAVLCWGHHAENWGAETRGSHCTPAGHCQDTPAAVLAILLGWRLSDSWGRATRPLINTRDLVPLGCGVYSPPEGCPLGRGVRELFLGLTQAAALGRWGLQREPSGRKRCFLPWAVGMERAGVGSTPLGMQPFCCGTRCPHPTPSHLPTCCGAAWEQRVPLKVPGAFAKPRNGKTMKLERFRWPLPLGPSLRHLPKRFPGAFQQNHILTQNGGR